MSLAADATRTLITQAQRRLELLGVEVADEAMRFTRLLFWELLAVFLSCLGFSLLLLLGIAAAWDGPNRLQVIGGCAALTLLGGALGGVMFRVQRRRMPPPFRDTAAELGKDVQALH
ncbi:MAG TPA: phage holin family protein [Candidatus Binatia bacterium]|nr:phage holin family protein [Candidatus Binatia bacterium]